MLKFISDTADATVRALKTSNNGLTQAEAEERLKTYGKNTVERRKKHSLIALFLSQFKDVLTILLIAAAIVSAVIAAFSGDKSDVVDTIIIIFIIILNAVVGCVQQYRADKAVENLKRLQKTQVKVRRDGKEFLIDSENVVIGDIIILQEGDVVPADCRIIKENNLKCDESALTGESVSVEKSAKILSADTRSLADAKNLIFSSTFVVSGSAEAAVYAVGMATEMGKIAKMITEEEPDKTPLEKSLATLGKVISAFALTATAIIFLSGIIVGQAGILKSFMTAVAVAVAAIPEGMPAVVTVIMAMGVTRMSKKRVIIRKLKSVETLGGCNYICTDKTGTLTNNKLKVEDVWFLNVNGAFGYGVLHDKLINCIRVCNSVKGKRGAYIGDSTEIALLNYADLNGFETAFEKIWEKPFDSNRKLMSVMVKTGGAVQLYIKGAPDVLIKKCTKILTPAGERRIAQEEIKKVVSETENYSKKAMRVLAFAYKNGSFRDEEDLTFIGLCAMIDGVKEGAALSVSECKRAGITTVMITGDHADTAFAVAKKVGIAEDKGQVILGEELDALPPKLRKEAVLNKRVFARVTPKHKNYVVKTLKANGNVVAMTGDGINDAPSIKSADIGVAMGSGTDVTKSAADMIITDDDFSTIVGAVAEGRRIFSNVKNTINFFLATNLAEVFAILIAAVFFASKNFLLSTQLLWINLITDTLPVLALGVERGKDDIMNNPPQRAEKSLFSKPSLLSVLIYGAYITVITVGAFALSLTLWGNEVASTITFLVISFAELFHAFNVRSESKKPKGKALIITVALGVVLNVLICVIPPVAKAFNLVALNGVQWLIVAALSLSVIAFGKIFKLIIKLKRKRAI
ncbi:MAG: cation-translocating P-type ATPase [Clostridia bacterium]|nr:cation-translocating P-type ATPase [Clostridia bacterium]